MCVFSRALQPSSPRGPLALRGLGFGGLVHRAEWLEGDGRRAGQSWTRGCLQGDLSRRGIAEEGVSEPIPLEAVEIPVLLGLLQLVLQFLGLLLQLLDVRGRLLLSEFASLTESRRGPCIALALLVSPLRSRLHVHGHVHLAQLGGDGQHPDVRPVPTAGGALEEDALGQRSHVRTFCSRGICWSVASLSQGALQRRA